MFLDGLNPAKGSAVRVLKNYLFLPEGEKKKENEKIKACNSFPLLQV